MSKIRISEKADAQKRICVRRQTHTEGGRLTYVLNNQTAEKNRQFI